METWRIFCALLVLISCSDMCIAQECDYIREEFLNGTFQVFNAKCADGDLFYVNRYINSTVPKPSGRNDSLYYATASSGKHCLKNRNSIDVMVGTVISLLVYKTPGEILCTVTILDDVGDAILEDAILRIDDEAWSNFHFSFDRDAKITVIKPVVVDRFVIVCQFFVDEFGCAMQVEMTCDFIDVNATIAIDSVLINRSCFTTTTTTEIETSTTGIATSTTTGIETTTLQYGPCKDVIVENFANGAFDLFTERCGDGSIFYTAAYINTDVIPKPPNATNGFYATSDVNSCVMTAGPNIVRSGAVVKVGLYQPADGRVIECDFDFYDSFGETLLKSTPLEVAQARWKETVVEWDREDDILMFMVDCVVNNTEVAIDYIHIINKC